MLPFAARGFTLVEMVVVIVVLGILSVGTVQFIRQSGEAFGNNARRAGMAQSARAALERISRELRDALPASVRADAAGCIEFIPLRLATHHFGLPTATPAGSVAVAAYLPGMTGLTGRLAVNPMDTSTLYASSSPGPAPLSGNATLGAPDASNVITATLDTPHQFTAPGPTDRIYLVADPVSFCVTDSRLYRYQNYGLRSAQPTPADLPAALPGRSLIASGLGSTAAPFAVAGATLERNAVVEIDLTFGSGEEALHLEHAVQLRNAP